MRIQLILLTTLISFSALGTDDKSMKELFNKYDQVMSGKNGELVEEVFTKKFLKESGGKNEFIEKVKELNKAEKKKHPPLEMKSWKKGVKNEVYFAKLRDPSKKEQSDSEFIVIKEDGKLKIDGTLSDGE